MSPVWRYGNKQFCTLIVALRIDCDAVLRDEAVLATCGTALGPGSKYMWCEYIKTWGRDMSSMQNWKETVPSQTWPILEKLEEKRMLFCMKKAKPR